eukprot:6124269-Amphidinium_carterae.1
MEHDGGNFWQLRPMHVHSLHFCHFGGLDLGRNLPQQTSADTHLPAWKFEQVLSAAITGQKFKRALV